MIDDPTDSKPADWVDETMIDDPEDKKPEGYDDIPAQVRRMATTHPHPQTTPLMHMPRERSPPDPPPLQAPTSPAHSRMPP
eukprot:scaffold7011_cov112-Isochrysis_galbana.AAC.10